MTHTEAWIKMRRSLRTFSGTSAYVEEDYEPYENVRADKSCEAYNILREQK